MARNTHIFCQAECESWSLIRNKDNAVVFLMLDFQLLREEFLQFWVFNMYLDVNMFSRLFGNGITHNTLQTAILLTECKIVHIMGKLKLGKSLRELLWITCLSLLKT
jgi:hypothetical protein